ncbi:sulfite exporter TauE/SafE family protein [Thalassovita sp.]|uniref:sulfite exporter TauE/SafE family protein n=1 Tax=Thalassovita sp. TaxID=1979401 RepID=UPI0029DE823F|nr:sulfite exporter TauE/SafE family protein [Thalassovita sp.]
MDSLFSNLTPLAFSLCLMVALLAGVIKGMVGFAMPMVMVSGLSSIVGAEWALAGLILPTVATNLWQALRQGRAAAWDSVKRFRVFLLCGLVTLVASAQLVRVLPGDVLLLTIGGPVVVFALIQLFGVKVRLPEDGHHLAEAGVGGFAGAIGGMSGIWGPPTVMYLTAINTPKRDQIRIQGVIYGLGAVALLGAHVGSGVMRAETLPFSLALLAPALAGTWLGFKVQDQIDQVAFRKATLVVLMIAGLNLIRRGLMG